jgi:hypothetical protein
MTPLDAVKAELLPLGIVVTQALAGWNVRHKHAKTGYFVETLDAALRIGKQIAANPPPAPEKPLGPLGSTFRAKRRGIIYRHNQKLLAQRTKKKLGSET